MSNWRTMRLGPAPRAARTPSSRSRAEARASSRLAAFPQAISSTSNAARRSRIKGRAGPTEISVKPSMSAPHAASQFGVRRIRCEARHDGAHLGLRLGDGDARSQAGNRIIVTGSRSDFVAA